MHKHFSYRSVLQLRPWEEHAISFVNTQIINNNLGCVYKEEHKNGIDFYFSNEHAAMILAKRIKKNIGGSTLITRKLYSYDKGASRKIGRTTILFKVKQKDL